MTTRIAALTVFCAAIPFVASTGEGAEGAAAMYAAKCASCHGSELQGGNAQSMVDGVWQYGAADWDLSRNIKFGISAVGMPNYGDVYTDDEIESLVAFIRAAEEEGGSEPPPLPERLYARDYDVRVEPWVDAGLEIPWALTFVDGKTALATERGGRLRVIRDGTLDPDAITGIPEVYARGQGGLMDVALDPDHPSNGWVYLAYSHALPETDGKTPSMTRIIRGRIDSGAWTDEELVFEAPPETYRDTVYHFGCRIVFDPEGRLYFSIGDRGNQDDAQDPHLPNGKIHRVWPDGSIPEDNPFADGAEGMPSVYTYGNRNPQGLAVHPRSGAVWETEHGPMGGDEVNVIESGVNYGWPKITYGLNYDGTPVSDRQAAAGLRQPVWYWAPSIAVCGIEFCSGDEFPRWRNQLLVGGLGHEVLLRLAITGRRVIHQEQLMRNAGRVRDVAVDPSGAIYVVLNKPDTILRLTNEGVARRQ